MAPVLSPRSVPACSFHATAFTADLLPRMAHCTVTLGLQLAGCSQPCCLAGLPLRGAGGAVSVAVQGPPLRGWSCPTLRISPGLDDPRAHGESSSPWTGVPISQQHFCLV